MTEEQQGNGMKEINHILRVPIFLRQNIRIIASLTILAWVLIVWSWQLKPPEPVTGWGGASWIGGILGLILGFRASQSLVAQPIWAAFGVAWRISVVWVVLAALAEGGKGEIQSALATMPFFPSLLVAFIGMIAGGFILGYLVHTFLLWIGVSKTHDRRTTPQRSDETLRQKESGRARPERSLQEIMKMLTILGAISAVLDFIFKIFQVFQVLKGWWDG